MFTNYHIKKNTLFLELNFNYEFGDFNNKSNTIISEIKSFIDSNKIKLKNKKIVLMCSGIIIGSIIIKDINKPIESQNIKYIPSFKTEYVYHSNENIIINNKEININETVTPIENTIQEKEIDIIKNEEINNETKNLTYVTIHRNNGSIVTMDLENYIIGVVAAEMPASFNIEAIKAQSVISRTYALKAMKTGKHLTDTVSTQCYIDLNQMKDKWGTDFDKYYNKIKNAVENTKDEYISYNDDYIEALYHSTNNGKTESSFDVFGNYYPYLVNVTSEYDKNASSYLRTINMNLIELSNKLGIDIDLNTLIEIISYTDGGNIKEIKINDSIFSGKQIRELLGLRSADFSFEFVNNSVNITTRGYGHGVGMSQYGANGMATAGYDYKTILSHYYPGTTIKK